MLDHLAAHLSGKVIILGIGNSLRSDDGAGSLLAQRLSGTLAYTVYDSGPTPENYLGKIIREKPDNIVIIDSADFGGKPGEFRVVEGDSFQTDNLFFTHNTSLTVVINYLKNSLKADIIILIIQPKSVNFSDELSADVSDTLKYLEGWFREQGKKQG
ncbi:MAG: hydrogenase 3 maturation endopeptidase HyCI [Candidatus Omnitrophica bacterium]|nr:hydrogenase 3 maturation endopeptidase HyCI [Candidatus Omnitrophota bacterium]